MSRVHSLHAPDYGDVTHATDELTVKKGGIFVIEDNQKVFYDGAGHKTWFATASAAAYTVMLPSADSSVGTKYTIKRVSGSANDLKIVAEAGNFDGTPTFTLATQYDFATFTSDGTDYFRIA